MSDNARSTGLVIANGVPSGVPTVGRLSGFDVIIKTALTVATVQIYDGSNSGTLLASASTNEGDVGFAVSVALNEPVKWDNNCWVELTAANAVVRYV